MIWPEKNLIFSVLLAIIFLFGCTGPTPPLPNATQIDNGSLNITPPTQNTSPPIPPDQKTVEYVKYENVQSYYNFTDPREGAFSIEVPQDWLVTNGSGVIRPYIDAGIAFQAASPMGQEFFYQDPYGYIYTTPNQVLDYTGFTEGSLYNPGGGNNQPMMVKHYMEADEVAQELLATSKIQITNINITKRPDLAIPSSPIITKQSAAELSFEYLENNKPMKAVFLVRTALVEISGTGVWSVSLFEYHSPIALLNQTEVIILNMQKSFKIDQAWAKREQEEIRKRAVILSQSQNDISEIITSTFEVRSNSMDDINQKWDDYIRGVENVYDPQTGQHYAVDAGSNYYWIGNDGTVYGTDVNENPLPDEDLQILNCPDCEG